MKPSLSLVTAEIHHGSHRATLGATGQTVAHAAANLAALDPGYLFTPGTPNAAKVIHELETTGQSSLGWVDYTVNANAPANLNH